MSTMPRHDPAVALKVPKGWKPTPSTVNGLTADAQWSFKANTSTRPALGFNFDGDINDLLANMRRRKHVRLVSMPSTPETRLGELGAANSKAQKAAKRAGDALHAAILEAHAEGQSLRQIAEASGLSFQRVHQIVSKP